MQRDGSSLRFADPDLPVRFPLHMQGDTLISFGSTKAFGRFNTRTKRFSSIPYPIPAQGGTYRVRAGHCPGRAGYLLARYHEGPAAPGPRPRRAGGYRCLDPLRQRPGRSAFTFRRCDLLPARRSDATPNILWVGTNGGGLNRFDKRTGQFSASARTDGLPNNVIYGLLADDDGQLWMSTNKGLSCFDPSHRDLPQLTMRAMACKATSSTATPIARPRMARSTSAV